MAEKTSSRRRSVTFTLIYVCLCVVASFAHSIISRVEGAASQADEATSKAADAVDRTEQNESDISELQDKVEDLQGQVESQ